jgi:hypothetical protein
LPKLLKLKMGRLEVCFMHESYAWAEASRPTNAFLAIEKRMHLMFLWRALSVYRVPTKTLKNPLLDRDNIISLDSMEGLLVTLSTGMRIVERSNDNVA